MLKFCLEVTTLGLLYHLATGAILSIFFFAPLATAKNSPRQYRLLQLPDKGNKHTRWSLKDGEKLQLKYAFVQKTLSFPDAYNCETMESLNKTLKDLQLSDEIVEIVQDSFDLWAKVTGFEFEYTTKVEEADILIGGYREPANFMYAKAAIRSSDEVTYGTNFLEIQKGAICLIWTSSFKMETSTLIPIL